MRLSIVIPTHGTRELVLRCLLSIEAEWDGGIEVIAVDDGSSDGTHELIAQRFGRARIIRHETARGFTNSVNEGLASARGDLLLILNSDTELRPRALAGLLDAFDDDPNLAIAGAALENPDGSRQWSGGRAPSLLWLFGLSSGLARWLRASSFAGRMTLGGPRGGRSDWVTGAAMAIHRSTYRLLGPLETAFRLYAQDMDYCLRAQEAGLGVKIVPGFRVMHRGGATVQRMDGAVGSSHPELLMLDLVTWATLRRGSCWARKARWALRLGVGLRVGARRLLAAFWRNRGGESFRDVTEALAAAGRALDRRR